MRPNEIENLAAFRANKEKNTFRDGKKYGSFLQVNSGSKNKQINFQNKLSKN